MRLNFNFMKVRKMADKKKKQVVICPSCGQLGIVDEESDDWLACLPLPADTAAIPAGMISLVTGVAKYVDGNGQQLSREEYIKLHGIDPAPVWEKIKSKSKRPTVTVGRR